MLWIHSKGGGRPAKRTPDTEAQVLRWFIHALVCHQSLPSDHEAGEVFDMCPRLIRQVRLDHGLNRREVTSLQQERSKTLQQEGASFVAYSPLQVYG